MKKPFKEVFDQLDKLFFYSPLKPDDKAKVVEAYLQSAGWTWDQYLEEITKEPKSKLN